MSLNLTQLPSANNMSTTTNNVNIQFFVRVFNTTCNTLVLTANTNDTIFSIHQKIYAKTNIPLSTHQRLTYQGKRLNPQTTLHEHSICNDAVLHLVVGRMRSSIYPLSYYLVNDIVSHVLSLLNNKKNEANVASQSDELELLIIMFFYHYVQGEYEEGKVPSFFADCFADHVQIFISCSVPETLVKLYTDSDNENKGIATDAIVKFNVMSTRNALPLPIRRLCMPVLLRFCVLLRNLVGVNDVLYKYCVNSMVKLMLLNDDDDDDDGYESQNVVLLIGFHDAAPFVAELGTKISRHLELGAELDCCFESFDSILWPHKHSCLEPYVRNFAVFLVPVVNEIMEFVELTGPIRFPIHKELCKLPACYVDEVIRLHETFIHMLNKLDECLMNIGTKADSETRYYLSILKELYGVSKIFDGCEEMLWETMKRRKDTISYLIIEYAYKYKHIDHKWILKGKEALSFEARRILAMLKFPELKCKAPERIDIVIDRSDLLASSFRYIGSADPQSLRAGLSHVKFKNEEGYGDGVLREWLLLLTQAIFHPENNLFVACPNDRKRFFPSAALKVDPLQLINFRVAGRVIALALMCKLQVCIRLDRVFFLQLAGHGISLENIQNADPVLYSSCMHILEMDPEILDRDALGLTFIHEIEESGKKKVIELCPGGKDIAVNSGNRKLYVHSLIEYLFMTAISEQVALFAQGFDDIVTCPNIRKSFFQSLYLEDLDRILHGYESEISVDDWRAHTKIYGFGETDGPLISWFWKIVDSMSEEQKKVLLFFWTSVKNLPFEGFSGLDFRLTIHKVFKSSVHLPFSKTCTYDLFIPEYGSFAVMRDRLLLITQEHISFGFGTP